MSWGRCFAFDFWRRVIVLARGTPGDAVVLAGPALPFPLLTRAVGSQTVGGRTGGTCVPEVRGLLVAEVAAWKVSGGVCSREEFANPSP